MGQVQYHRGGDTYARVDGAFFDHNDATFEHVCREVMGVTPQEEEDYTWT